MNAPASPADDPPASVSGKLTLATPPRPPKPPAPAAKAPPPAAPAASRKAQPLTTAAWISRALTVLLLAGAVGLVTWNYRRLLPVQKKARETSALVNRLSAEIALMETRTSPDAAQQVAENYAQAQALLFSSPEALKDWFQRVRREMVPLALDATADFGRPTAANPTNLGLAVVPATLALSIQPALQVEGVRSPYERVLRFLDQLSRQEKRVDVLDLQVHGGSNSVSRAVATLQLWAGEGRRE
jgi:hypothetical protein